MCVSLFYKCTIIVFFCVVASHGTEKKGHKFIIRQTRSFYMVYSDYVTWKTAKEHCADAGAELWVPANLAEQREVQMKAARSVWTGINDVNNTGTFRAPDGRPLNIDKKGWGKAVKAAKKLKGNYSCVNLYRAYLYPKNCDMPASYVCKFPTANPPAPTAAPQPQATTPLSAQNLTRECTCSPPGQAGAGADILIEEELQRFPQAERLQLLISILNVIKEHADKKDNRTACH